jgi:cell division protein FtsN
VEATLPDAAFAAPAAATGRRPPSATAPQPAPPLRGAFAVQVGAFAVEANARRLAATLPVPAGTTRVEAFEDNRGSWWRVRVAGYDDEIDADAAAAALTEAGYTGMVVRLD